MANQPKVGDRGTDPATGGLLEWKESPSDGSFGWAKVGDEEAIPDLETPSFGRDLATSAARFGRGFVVEPAQELLELGGRVMTEPRQTLLDLITGIPQAQGEQFQKAQEAYSEGNLPGSIGHLAAYGVPLIGPAIANIVEEGAETGDWSTATGRLAQFGVPGIKGAKMRPTTATRTPLTFVERRKAQGKTGPITSAAGWGESLLERTIAGAPVYRPCRAVQHAAISGYADDLVRKISPTAGPIEAVGSGIKRSLEQIQSRRAVEAGKLYDKFEEIASRPVPGTGKGVQVNTGSLKHAAQRIKTDLEAGQEVVTGSVYADAMKELDQILKTAPEVSVKSIIDARSLILGMERQLKNAGMPSKKLTVFQGISRAMDTSLKNAAKKSRRPELYTAWRDASNHFKETKQLLDTDFTKKIRAAKRGEERIVTDIANAPLADVRRLWRVLPGGQKNKVRSSLVRKYFDEAATGELETVATQQRKGPIRRGLERAGLTQEGVPLSPVSARKISGSKLQTSMEKIGADRLGVVLGKDATEGLKQLVGDSMKIGARSVESAPGLVAAGMNATMLSPILNPFGIGLSLQTALPMALGLNALSRLFVKQPQALPLHRAFFAALNRRDTKGAAVIGIQLQKMLEAELSDEEKESLEAEQAETFFEQNPVSAFDPQITPVPQQPQGPRTGPPRR